MCSTLSFWCRPSQNPRLAAVEDEPLEGFGVFDDLFHLVFDLGEVLFAQLVRAVEVVVVAVGERRAEGEVHVGEEPHDRAGHDVPAGVPQDAQRLGVAIGEQAEVDGLGDVGHF